MTGKLISGALLEAIWAAALADAAVNGAWIAVAAFVLLALGTVVVVVQAVRGL